MNIQTYALPETFYAAAAAHGCAIVCAPTGQPMLATYPEPRGPVPEAREQALASALAALIAIDPTAETWLHTPTNEVTTATDPRLYVLSTGGGHASLRARPPMTADEVRAWVRRDHGGLSLSERRRLSREIESALESGAGRGEAGCYSMGTAAGRPIVRWSIVETRA